MIFLVSRTVPPPCVVRGPVGRPPALTTMTTTPTVVAATTPDPSSLPSGAVLADVGLVGFPNAGKSTLIRQMSRSKARVADYPFTTLVPNLGVVTYEDDRAFVIADVPGLIEGAAEGAGLGHQFLRHIERTRVLVYFVEVTGGMMPSEAYRILLSELTRYEAELAQRPSIICINKCDLVDEDTLQLALEDMAEAGITNPVFLSALEGTGTDALRDRIVAVLDPH